MARTPLKKQIQKKQQEEPVVKFNPSDFISSGSTLLNLAMTDHPFCAWQLGKMANLIGDSSSGKTFIVLTTFAEAAVNKHMKNHRLVFDDVENANEFNMEYLFGENLAERIEAPAETEEGDNLPSDTIEDFHDNILTNIENKQPCIYALDSFDALDAEADQDKVEEFRKARRKGTEAKGTYGMAKPKKASEILRQVVGKLKRTSSSLIIVSQTRDDINPMSFTKKTRSGGKALKFYATHEIWTASGGAIKKGDKVIGVKCIAKVSKNKITGKVREVQFPIYYDMGIDDIASCIEWLVKEGFWTQAKGAQAIDPKGTFDLVKGTKASLIAAIEKGCLERKLSMFVGKCWNEVEDSLKLNRKKRY